MTNLELKQYIDQLLTRVGTDRVSASDIRTVLKEMVDYTDDNATDGIAAWADDPESYDTGDLVVNNDRIWKSKVDGNLGNQPPQDTGVTEDDYWVEVSKSTNLADWSPGIIGEGLFIAVYNNEFYKLVNATRPYESTNIVTEIAAGDWERMLPDALNSITGLITSADQMIYTTAADTYAVTTLSAFGRSVVGAADAAAARTVLGAAPAAHTHAAADVTSGTFDTARIPSLAASKITSGTFANARISQASITQHQSALSIGYSQLTSVPLGSANGIAPLDASAKIDASYLPDSIVGQVEYKGTWAAATNTPAIPAASSSNKGHYYIATSDVATGHGYANVPNVDFKTGDWIISDGSSWSKVDNTDAVTTVFGRNGAIMANSGDYAAYYLRHDVNTQNLTSTQKSNARTNLGFTNAILDRTAPGDIGGTTPGLINGTVVSTSDNLLVGNGTGASLRSITINSGTGQNSRIFLSENSSTKWTVGYTASSGEYSLYNATSASTAFAVSTDNVFKTNTITNLVGTGAFNAMNGMTVNGSAFVDASRNVTAGDITGITSNWTGLMNITRASQAGLQVNRTTTNGTVVEFQRDGATGASFSLNSTLGSERFSVFSHTNYKLQLGAGGVGNIHLEIDTDGSITTNGGSFTAGGITATTLKATAIAAAAGKKFLVYVDENGQLQKSEVEILADGTVKAYDFEETKTTP